MARRPSSACRAFLNSLFAAFFLGSSATAASVAEILNTRAAARSRAATCRLTCYLLAGCFPERVVDALLPARAAFLEEIEHVAVDAQRNQLLHARERRGFSRCRPW